TAFALSDDGQDLVGAPPGSAARQGYEEPTGGEVTAEGEDGHGRTTLDFLLAREHARGAASHHLRGTARLARGAGDAREAGTVRRSCEHEQQIGALEVGRAKRGASRVGRSARRVSLCRESHSRAEHAPFSGDGPLEQEGAGIANARARKPAYRAITSRRSARKSAGRSPGSRRQSSCALASSGMTLVLGLPSRTVGVMVLRMRAF